MKLLTFHRILIVCAIVFCAVFVVHQALAWRRDGSQVALGLSIAFTVFAGALTWYLTNLRRFLRDGGHGAEDGA